MYWPAYLLRGGKRTMYEGGLRIPMVARWPGPEDRHVPRALVMHAKQQIFRNYGTG